ncbi:MAG: dihydroorotase [Breznakia sp.]
MIIRNARIVVKDNETKVQDIFIQNGLITRIADYIEGDEDIIDAQESLVLPGGIDVHVHLREPGYPHKETIETGAKAAIRGGYTTIMAMPNVIPYPDKKEIMMEYLALLKQKGDCNIYPYACITQQEAGKHLVDMQAMKQLGIKWFSDDGVGIQEEEVMREAMLLAKAHDVMIVAHTEDMKYRKKKACMHEGIRNQELHLQGIPSACEFMQVKRDLQLAYETGCKYHICHMSCKESVELLKEYKAKGADVSGEVTCHHLLLNEHDVQNSNHKMNPPLRSLADQQALRKGLLDGTIDIIANDHAPHSETEKNQEMENAPFGIVALETSIPLLYTKFVKKGYFTLSKFQDVISKHPAQRFGFVKKGKIKEGYEADLICLQDKKSTIQKEAFLSLGKNTPFDQWEIDADIAFVIIGGHIKYQHKEDQYEA